MAPAEPALESGEPVVAVNPSAPSRSAPSHCSERGPWRAPRHADPRLDPDAYAELRLRRVLDTQERGLLDLFGRHLADDADGDGRADPERHAYDRRERPHVELRVAAERVDDQASHRHRLTVAPDPERADLADEDEDQQESDGQDQDERDGLVESRCHERRLLAVE